VGKRNKMHPSDKERYKIMKELITSDNKKIIVDIGGGLYSIANNVESKKIIIIDGDKSFKPTIVADLNNPLTLKDNSVDIVIAGEIIEHLINPFRFLKEINRILKKGGELILSTPNAVDLKSRIKVLFGRLPTNCARAFPTQKDHLFFHKTDWNWKILIEFFEKAGFKIEKKKTNGLFLGTKFKIPCKICPLAFGEKIIIKAVKK
jgi:SAM-dependent methyltransferase